MNEETRPECLCAREDQPGYGTTWKSEEIKVVDDKKLDRYWRGRKKEIKYDDNR